MKKNKPMSDLYEACNEAIAYAVIFKTPDRDRIALDMLKKAINKYNKEMKKKSIK